MGCWRQRVLLAGLHGRPGVCASGRQTGSEVWAGGRETLHQRLQLGERLGWQQETEVAHQLDQEVGGRRHDLHRWHRHPIARLMLYERLHANEQEKRHQQHV